MPKNLKVVQQFRETKLFEIHYIPWIKFYPPHFTIKSFKLCVNFPLLLRTTERKKVLAIIKWIGINARKILLSFLLWDWVLYHFVRKKLHLRTIWKCHYFIALQIESFHIHKTPLWNFFAFKYEETMMTMIFSCRFNYF